MSVDTVEKNITETGAWADAEHAQVFDYLHKRPAYFLKRHYESFSEGRFLRQLIPEVQGKTFFEVGCATGELYRYLKHYHKHLAYMGFDISKPAIERARYKFPQADFRLLDDNHAPLADCYGKASIVWCRDVVLHQEDPFGFITKLIELAEEALILRLRTREKGATCLDVKISCQFHWDRHWVPYIILNTTELLKFLSGFPRVSNIVVARRFEVLGGHNYRFLPKDLYESATGTAETAILIKMGKNSSVNPSVSYVDRQDMPTYGYLERIIMKIINSL